MSANRIRWGHQALELEISLAEDGTARLVHLGAPGEAVKDPRPGTALPLVELTAAGHGRHWSGRHLIDTTVGARLRHPLPAAGTPTPRRPPAASG